MPTNEEIVDVLKFETDNIPITEGINFEDMAKNYAVVQCQTFHILLGRLLELQ